MGFQAEAACAPQVNAAPPATTEFPELPQPKVRRGREGPWGHLELVPIVLQLPEVYATAERAMGRRDRWNFAGLGRASALALMAECGLAPAQLSQIAADDWREGAGSCSVEPSDALVLSLSPEARAALYAKLMADPANASAISPAWFRAGHVDFRLRGSGLGEASVAILKQLIYAGADGTLLFNDDKVALRAIADPAERMRFLLAVTRKRALLARLVIGADDDTGALAAYWGAGGRAANLLPLLDAMKFNAIAGVESLGKINLASLLPPFVQQRLYRHADGSAAEDCFWTAFNFFNPAPDDRVRDMGYLAGLLQHGYARVPGPARLGDVILIATAGGDAVHAANYIAEDVVFTKNGESVRQPWILTGMRDMLTQYLIKNAKVQVACYRRRG